MRVANLIVDRQHEVSEQRPVEGLVARNVDAASVTEDVIDLVDVDRVATVAHDVKQKSFFVRAFLRSAFNEVHDELGVFRIRLYTDLRILFQYLVK